MTLFGIQETIKSLREIAAFFGLEDKAKAVIDREMEKVQPQLAFYREKLRGKKVNSVLIPGLNDAHPPTVAWEVRDWGADLFNIIPLLPREKMASSRPPTRAELEAVRQQVAGILPQITHCNRCRADATGLLTEEGVLCTGA